MSEHILYSILIIVGLPLLSFLFYKLAHKLNIIDDPNGRSSHSHSTVTSMGILFIVATLIFQFCFQNLLTANFFLALFMLSAISLWDDIRPIKNSYRFIVQITSLFIMVYGVPLNMVYAETLPVILTLIIFGIGVINAFNFMDGINGLLGLNSLVILACLLFLNDYKLDENGQILNFFPSELIWALIWADIVFLFYNFRKKALGFAGDVGSMALSFTIYYMIILLLIETQNLSYVLLFVVMGIDAGLTVLYKLILKENIFVAHRDFLFKKLVHLGKFTHKQIAILYALIQLIIGLIVLSLPTKMSLGGQLGVIFITIIALIVVYITVLSQFTRKRKKRRVIKIN